VRGETRHTTRFKKESGGTAANREFKAKGKRRASRSRSSFLHALISQRVLRGVKRRVLCMSLWQGGRELKTLVCSGSVKTQVQCHAVARTLSLYEDARLMKV
jgi:hypothetical protein